AVLARHIDLLAPGARPSDFVLAANVEAGGLRTVSLLQRAGGAPVIGGQVSMRFRRDRLFVIASEASPVAAAAAPAARAAAAALTSLARARARRGALALIARERAAALPGRAPAPARAGPAAGPLVLPLHPRRGAPHARVVLAVPVAADRPLTRATVWLDAVTGEPVARRDDLRSATATLLYDTPVRWPGGARAAYPAARAAVTLDGTATTTDDDGLATWPGGGDADAVAEATGSLVEVVDDGGDPATAALTLPAGGQVVWSEAEIDARDAQLTTFIHAGLARRRARALAPELAWLARPQRATVNIDQTCNAFSDGDAVYFFRAGD